MLELVLSDTFYFDSNEPLKKPDTRAVKPERRVQSGCEAERYPRLGTGGSPARLGSGGSPARLGSGGSPARLGSGGSPARLGSGGSPAPAPGKI